MLAPLIARLVGHGPDDQFLDIGLTPEGLPRGPSRTFLLGTDGLGRDVLVRVAYGARVSLLVGVVASALAVLVGVVVGIAAGWFGGAIDTRPRPAAWTSCSSFPFLLFAIALVVDRRAEPRRSAIGDHRVLQLGGGGAGRPRADAVDQGEGVRRGGALARRERRADHVRRHPPERRSRRCIVYLTLLIPAAIVFEATLSFLGLGVVPPTPSWGNMLADALSYYRVAWWFVLFPGVGAAGHDPGVQPARRQRPRRVRPARRTALQEVAMARFLVRRICSASSCSG